MKQICLLRYDTEAARSTQDMNGFLERVLEVHREHKIPTTLYSAKDDSSV